MYRLILSGTIEELIYQRQVYKQQMANIGVKGSDERRYFTGVHGVKGEEGELFGLTNLLRLNLHTLLSKDLVDRCAANPVLIDALFTHSSAATDEAQYKIEQSRLDKDAVEGEKMSDMAAVFGASLNADMDESSVINLEPTFSVGDDAVAEALARAGVVYTHNNQHIIGASRAERVRGELAMRSFPQEAAAVEVPSSPPAWPMPSLNAAILRAQVCPTLCFSLITRYSNSYNSRSRRRLARTSCTRVSNAI